MISPAQRKFRQNNNALVRVTILLAVVCMLVIANVFVVTVFGYHMGSGTSVSAYSGIATTTETIYARRGYIFDRNGYIIAQDSVSYNMMATLDNTRPSYEGVPAYVPYECVDEYSEKIATVLGCEKSIIKGYLTQDLYQTEFGPYGRGLSESIKNDLEALELYGIEFTEQNSRNYPLGTFASHLIGYTRYSADDDLVIGEMGIESLLNDYLIGKNGSKTYSQDANGIELLGTQIDYTAAQNGNNIYLTIDRSCQEALELLMKQTTTQFNAQETWGGVMEVSTGKMLAWGCTPSFNPNEMNITNYLDLGAGIAYEPGSTMKTFTYAAAIDSGKYDGSKKIYTGPYYVDYTSSGRLKRASSNKNNGVIRNFNNLNFGYITFDQAYFRSLNVGIAEVLTQVISPSVLKEYLTKFGFFQRVNTPGVADVAGEQNMDYGLDQIATGYGQSSSVTALQMFQAYSAIFNGGKMMKPYFIDYIEDPYTNEVIYQGTPTVVGQPISESTAKQVVKLMRQVVTNEQFGTAKRYALSEMPIAAKTGTGEVYENGKYGTTVIASIAVGFPANDPQIFVYFCYKAKYSSNMHYSTGPIKRFMRKIIKIMNIQNTSTPADEPGQASTDPSSEIMGEDVQEEIDLSVKLSEVPNLLNYSTSYAKSLLSGNGLKVVTLGSGDTVIRQYPAAGENLEKKQRVFLLTSLSKIKMPDMTGWSRSDVYAFWELTGIGVITEGNGYVTEQNIDAGKTLQMTDTITVKLSQ